MLSFPVEIGFGKYFLSAHLMFETLAFVVGFKVYQRLRATSQDAISEANRYWILIGAAFGAFLFSRLVGAMENPMMWVKSPYPLLYFFLNKTIVGALVGGLLGVEIVKKIIGEKSSSGDLFTYPLIIAMMIGRIGCFLNGVYEPTFGVETTFPWGMDLGDGLQRHPVALYEITFLLFLLLCLRLFQSKLLIFNGLRFKVFMITYFLFRFFIEYIKPTPKFYFGFSVVQATSLLLIAYYYKTILGFLSSLLFPKKMVK
jgi:prolipoprotein diacylglyceryltransferase